MKITQIDEVSYGTYVWQMPDGSLVTDEDGNYLCIYATKGDPRKIKLLRDAAKHYGLEDGSPMWMSGNRPITEDEYENQKQRMDWGLVADEWDIPALKEDLQNKKKMGLL